MMRAAVIDLTQGDEIAGHPVVNVIVADPEIDEPPAGCVLIASDEAGVGWIWTAADGFAGPEAHDDPQLVLEP